MNELNITKIDNPKIKNKDNFMNIILIFGVCLIFSAFLISEGIKTISSSKNIITVTGSAKESITSDYGYISINITSKSPTSDLAYSKIIENNKKIIDFFKKLNIKDESFSISMININEIEKYNQNGNPTGEILYYQGSETLTIESSDVQLIERISKLDIRELYNLEVKVNFNLPVFSYTGAQDLKINMQAKATQDAKQRALKIAEASGSDIDRLVNARMGVIQIVPKGSTEVSDWGYNDNSSIEKEIIAVVNVSFSVK